MRLFVLLLITVLCACVRVLTTRSDDWSPQGSFWAVEELQHRYQLAGNDGRTATVYVFDGGIDSSHIEFGSRVRKGFAVDTGTCNNHGTAVAGAIGGKFSGVAPKVQLVDVHVIYCENLRGTVTAIERAVAWVVQDHILHPGPAVVNWSFIFTDSTDTEFLHRRINDMLTVLRSEGIYVIAAAGNMFRDACDFSPANSHNVVVVGSSTIRGTVQPNTAVGKCVDVYAPGDSVKLPTEGPDGYAMWEGTSLATGYISGVVALWLESHPHATLKDIRQYLKRGENTVLLLNR